MQEGPLIAVVDDDISIRNATQHLLRSAGYATAAFSNAASFLDSTVRPRVACLVTDLRMPGLTGAQLYEHLAASGGGIPTILITAHPGELDRERLVKAGLTCFLIKPFAPDELLECVRKGLERARARQTIPRS